MCCDSPEVSIQRMRRKSMDLAKMMEQIAEASPSFKARVAAALYFLSLLTAVLGESVGGDVGFAAGELAVAGMVAMTLLFYDIFKPVNRSLSLLAAFLNLVGLTFEAFRWNPQGVDIALVFVGLQHLLIGYLILKSSFLPRSLSVLMVFAGLAWLTYMSNPLANHLSPYNTASGIAGEGLVYLWLLVRGLDVQGWQEQAGAGGHWRSPGSAHLDSSAR
jgi:hypothetical protein